MSNDKPTVAIIGHSFIRRLDEKLWGHSFPRGFDLNQCVVVQRGLGGFRMCKGGAYHGDNEWYKEQFKAGFGEFLTLHKPSVVILQLGENDIDSKCDSLVIASTLDEIVLLLKAEYRVQIVVVCGLFTREKPRIAPELYDTKRQQTNDILETLLQVHDGVKLWKHRRIFNAETRIFSFDGVHLNPFGQQRFYRSLRHAIMTAVRCL